MIWRRISKEFQVYINNNQVELHTNKGRTRYRIKRENPK